MLCHTNRRRFVHLSRVPVDLYDSRRCDGIVSLNPVIRLMPLLPVRNSKLWGLFLLFAAITCVCTAQVTITIQGTITGAAAQHNYTNSQAVTFSFVLNEFNGAPAAGVASTGVYYQWVEDNLTDTPIYTSVSGTGLTGNWSRSTAFDGSAYAYLQAHQDSSPGQLYLLVGTNVTPGDMGLTVNGYELTRLEVNVQLAGFSPTVTDTLPDSTAFFSALAGTYADSFQPASYIRTHDGSSQYTTSFAVDSVSISVVPEPSTWAAVFGLSALGFAFYRRRKIKT